jgi:GNAT superfamily N-acetyltransferase
MLNYKKGIPAITDLLALYSSVGWTNYTNNPTMLEEAVKASLWQLAVYDKEELVAYIRLVGDGHSVLLVQDLLVRPDYQRQGIGKKTLRKGFRDVPPCLSTAPCH